MGFGGGGGTTNSIAGAVDVALSNPANNHFLAYDTSLSSWKNSPIPGGSGIEFLSESEYAALATVNPDILYVIFPNSGGGPGHSWLVRDDFAATENPPAQTDTGQAYQTTGVWTSGGGNLSASADGALITVDIAATTQTVEAVWAGPWANQSFPTFVMLYASDTTHYRIQRGAAGASTIAINRRGGSGDANNLYTTPSGAVAAGDTVRVAVTRAVGNTQFTIWVNNVQVGTYTDTASNPPGGTRAGFRYGAGSDGTGFAYRALRADNQVVGP